MDESAEFVKLAQKAQKGDKQAFVKLIKASEASLYRVAKAIVKSDADCADAIQESILKAFEAMPVLKKPVYFKTWLTQILINECRKIHTARKKVVSLEASHFRDLPGEDGQDEQIQVRQALKFLDEHARLLVTLFYFEDMAIKDIAKVLKLPEGTVKSRLHRARIKLADNLKKERGACNEG